MEYTVKIFKEFGRNIVYIKELNNYFEIPEIDNNRYTLCIHPSRKCNLACKYCFGEEGHLPTKEIAFDVVKDAIDFIIYDYGKNGCCCRSQNNTETT